jgi:hypothetical protein
VALYRLAILAGIALAFGGCDTQKTQGQSQAQPVVEVTPATQATADVDRRATLALKQSLLTTYPEATASDVLEMGLVHEGYVCGPNPSAPSERACLKAQREGPCEVNTIIRSQPYVADKSQVIRICDVSAPKE